jgi:4-carboxymuconolactone decarboxylase
MARIGPASRENVPADQQEAFDAFVAERGGVPPSGPLAVMLNAPEILARGEHLRAYLRGDSVNLSGKTRELAMLVTARENDCQYIWHAHAAAARRAGLSDDLVNNLRDKRPLTGISAEETAVVEFGREYFRTQRVSQPTFDAASNAFGVRGLTELTSLMGYYALLAFNINAFEMLPEAGDEAPLPV